MRYAVPHVAWKYGNYTNLGRNRKQAIFWCIPCNVTQFPFAFLLSHHVQNTEYVKRQSIVIDRVKSHSF